jgi:hypothetical protein
MSSRPQPSYDDPLRLDTLQSEERWLKRKTLRRLVLGFFMGGVGLILVSVLSELVAAGLIGLGLLFLGALFLFVGSTQYVKRQLLDFTTISSLSALSQFLRTLGYTGKGIYYPSQQLLASGIKGWRVFICASDDCNSPPPNLISKDKIFYEQPKGVCITPPGSGLCALFEKELRTDFSKVDMNYIKNKLPRLLIEGLEIAEDFRIEVEENLVRVSFIGSIFYEFCSQIRRLPQFSCESVGCPLCSSIACLLATVTNRPVIIERTELVSDKRRIGVQYKFS